MKKILTTILAGTMVAGAAFAADAKINLNLRQQGTAWEWTKQKETPKGGSKTTASDKVNWVNFNNYAGAADSFKFVLNGDAAGVTLELNPNYDSGDITIKQYNAYMKFGGLTLSAGKWGDGFLDANYRVKKDNDAQNGNGQDIEAYKLGSMFGKTPANFIDDLTKKSTAGVAEYSLDLNDDMKLNIAAVAFKNTFDTVKHGKATTDYNAGWSGRVQFNIAGLLNSEVIVRKESATATAFGLYVQPAMLDALTATIGGSFALASARDANGGKKANGTTADDEMYWNVDLRLRYQVMDPLSITFYTNVSGATSDGGHALEKGVAGVQGKDGWATKNPVKLAMWNNLNGRYKINDTFTATLNLGLITALAGNDLTSDKKVDNGIEWRVTPAVQIFAASNASIWTGVAISGSSWTDKNDKDISVFSIAIPVVFRVKM